HRPVRARGRGHDVRRVLPQPSSQLGTAEVAPRDHRRAGIDDQRRGRSRTDARDGRGHGGTRAPRPEGRHRRLRTLDATGAAGGNQRAHARVPERDSRMAVTLPTGEAKEFAVRGMFDAIAPRYDLVNRIMTFGMEFVWRRLAVAWLSLPDGSRVLDVACGTGDLCRELAR